MCKCNTKSCSCSPCKQCSCSKSCDTCLKQAKKTSSTEQRHHIGYSSKQEQEQEIASASDVIKRSRKGD